MGKGKNEVRFQVLRVIEVETTKQAYKKVKVFWLNLWYNIVMAVRSFKEWNKNTQEYFYLSSSYKIAIQHECFSYLSFELT